MADFRLPNITASTPTGQIQQMQSYMYQLVQQLNWAMSTIDSAAGGNSSNVVLQNSSSGKSMSSEEAINTFNSIKALIIKSADIVQAYYDKLRLQFNGDYLAISDFGDYAEQTQQTLLATSQSIKQNYESIEVITGQINTILKADAYIKSGELGQDGSGNKIYGVEVGQTNIVDGIETFNKYARFTADGIYFYLPGSTDAIAYMTGNKLYITNAEISGTLKLGRYIIDTSNGLTISYLGG